MPQTAHPDLSFYNKKDRPWLGRLDQSAIVGHTTATTSRLWMRVKRAGHYTLCVFNQPVRCDHPGVQVGRHWLEALHCHKETVNIADGSRDFTHTFELTDLSPDTRYYYGIFSEDEKLWILGQDSTLSFLTLPEERADHRSDITFGFYSCHMPFHPNSASSANASLWTRFAEELKYANARCVLGGGDQVYADGVPYLSIWNWLKKVQKYNPTQADMVSWYRDIYRGYWQFPDLQKVHRSFPNYMIWDDHEIMDGWGSYTDKELSQQLDTLLRWEDEKRNVRLAKTMFKAATQVYEEYQHSHNPVTAAGVWDYTFQLPESDTFVMDMRGCRDFQKKSHAILGKKQHQRLKDWAENLQEASERPGPIFVVSTVPLVHLREMVSNLLDWASIFGGRDDVRDHWAHESHQAEIVTLLDVLFGAAKRTRRPLVVLSGDVHIGGIFSLFSDKPEFKDVTVYQVTSSPVTYAALGPAKMAMLGKAVAPKGTIGCRPGEVMPEGKSCGYRFVNHRVFVQNNIALVRYSTEGQGIQQLSVELIGEDVDRAMKESTRVDLLKL
ncbi:alkaline phosphatase D family protein [Pokkaliibacter sp. CJK22405]|uniref:alkaline phosphatase D family protein n=1 Tax=Pokkaliibacter sp. CJK22405 TaxID=3384615 RepID=UPI0039856AA7